MSVKAAPILVIVSSAPLIGHESRPSTLRQREVQDLEGDLGLVLGVDGEFADRVAEMSVE